MSGLTLTVALCACLAVMALKPRHALGVYLAVLMAYPSYLSVKMLGTVDVTAGRVVVAALLLKGLAGSRGGRARLQSLDYLLLTLFGWGTLALMLTEDAGVLENRAGAFMDTVMGYIAARLLVRDKADLMTVGKWAAAIAIPIAALGVIESVWGWSPYESLRAYSFVGEARAAEPRWGFHRASGAVGLHIAFGMCFVLLLPILLSLSSQKGSWTRTAGLACVAAVFGTFSSMSSAPLLSLTVFGACAVLILKPSLVKPVLIGLALIVVAAQIGSNRPVYHLVGYLTFGDSASWYRARLIEVAWQKLPEYWSFGYGFRDPGWGVLIDGRNYTDVCNAYVLLAVRHGALAPLLFAGALASSVARLRKCYRSRPDPAIRKSAWYMGSVMIGIGFGAYAVGLLAAMETVLYLLFGMVASQVFEAARPYPGCAAAMGQVAPARGPQAEGRM